MPEDNFPIGGDQLLKPQDGVAPKTRMRDAGKCREIAQRFLNDSDQRDNFFAKMKRQLDGNPPYDQAKLDQEGQSYRANFNTMEATAYRDVAITPHYDLYSSGQVYFWVKVNGKKLGLNPTQTDEINKAISEIANRMVDEWYGFDANNQPMISDKVWFGKGFLMWEEERDWHYNYIPQNLVKVPNGTKSDIDRLPIMVIYHEWTVSELWEKIHNQEAATARGWNREACLQAIADAMPKDPQTQIGTAPDYIGLQQALNDHDLYTGYYSEVIKAASVFVREFDGKISHSIVTLTLQREAKKTENVSYQEAKTAEEESASAKQQDRFLFQKIGRYDNWRQFIAPFFLKCTEDTWHGSSGLGKDIYGMMQAKTRLECAAWDLAFIRSGVVLQPATANDMEKIGQVSIGAITVLPPGFSVQQSTIMGDMQGPLEMLDHSDQLLQRNTGVYRTAPGMRDKGNPPTLGAVQLAYQTQSQLTNSMVSRFYRDLDKFYTELFRRLCFDEDFRKAVKDEGIDERCLDKENIVSVKASRVIGNGSPQNRIMAIGQTAGVVPSLPEKGQIAWRSDLIAAVADRETAQRWNPQDQPGSASDHERMAQLENAAIQAGGSVNVTDTDNDSIHLDQHIHAKAMALQSVQQGADPLHVVDFVDRVSSHEQPHWFRLKQDKTHEQHFKALAQANAQILQQVDQLRGHVDKAMAERRQNAQQAQQMAGDPLTRMKMQAQQQKMELTQRKTEQQLSNKQRAADQDIQIKDATAAAEIRRKSWSAFTPESQ